MMEQAHRTEGGPRPEDCLGPTRFIDCDAEAIRACAARIAPPDLDPRQRAVALFNFVRDRILYEFMARLTAEEYVASHVLAAGRGFCVQKAVLLCALGRAAGVPAALVMTDLRDHTLPAKVVQGARTNVLYYHGLAAFHLDGRWVKADAALSPDLVERKGYRRVEFDGTGDALLAATTLAGAPHAEYIAEHGLFADLPLEAMLRAFDEGYRGGDLETLQMIGVRPR